VPDAHDPHRPRHRADPALLGYADRARALLSLLPGRERPRPAERPAPPLRAPGTRDLQPTDPRTIGAYQILARLGSGSQGVVYLAATASGALVAIKRLHCAVENDQARRQFAKEIAAAGRVAPFCTAQLIDAHLDGPAPYLVSEYIQGPSLRQKISQEGPMAGATLHRLAVGTATALAAIHQAGVVHRDIQPANVMLSPEGPRVVDFGIARDLTTEVTTTSAIIGTPAYMSPEQISNQPAGPPTDMFAWASIVAYAATGQAPFQADHPMALAYRIAAGAPTLTGVPASLIPVLRRCLEKDPARRPTAQQALATLLSRPELQNSQSFRTPPLIRQGRVVEAVTPVAVVHAA
jgi:serine/threonine protein kinase